MCRLSRERFLAGMGGVVLDRGQIVAEGTHAELLRQGGVYARLFQMQWRDGEDITAALAAMAGN